jgi:hypothetical protein
MKIDGRCHCGYVTFEAEADPETTTICNCTDCQAMSGAPLRAVIITHPESRPHAVLTSRLLCPRKQTLLGGLVMSAYGPLRVGRLSIQKNSGLPKDLPFARW